MSKHVVKTVTLQLHCANRDIANRCQSRLQQRIIEQLSPLLSALFDEFDTGNNLVQIPRLQIDIAHLNLKTLEKQLLQKTLRKVREQLSYLLKNTDLSAEMCSTHNDQNSTQNTQSKAQHQPCQVISKRQSEFDTLQHYLTRGALPWSANNIAPASLLKTVLSEQISSLSRWLAAQLQTQNTTAVIRLFDLLTPTQLQTLIATLVSSMTPARSAAQLSFTAPATLHRRLCETMTNPPIQPSLQKLTLTNTQRVLVEHAIWHFVLCWLLDKRAGISATSALSNSLAAQQKCAQFLHAHYPKVINLLPPLTQEFTPPNPSYISDYVHQGESEYFIETCGMILLWPLLAHFFSTLGWYNAKSKELQQKEAAVWLLHYLITGKAAADENSLVLAKLLCDYPLQQAIHCRLTQTQLQLHEITWQPQTESLLNTLLSKLRPTKDNPSENLSQNLQQGIQWLRQLLLQREGKLSYRHGMWLLRVSSSPVDVLLKKLPWPLATIKLPWMPQALQVEWSI